MDALLLEDLSDLHIPLLRNPDERVLGQPFYGIEGGACQRVVRWEHRHKLIPAQGKDLQVVSGGQSQKTTVCLPLADQVLHLCKLPLAQ